MHYFLDVLPFFPSGPAGIATASGSVHAAQLVRVVLGLLYTVAVGLK